MQAGACALSCSRKIVWDVSSSCWLPAGGGRGLAGAACATGSSCQLQEHDEDVVGASQPGSSVPLLSFNSRQCRGYPPVSAADCMSVRSALRLPHASRNTSIVLTQTLALRVALQIANLTRATWARCSALRASLRPGSKYPETRIWHCCRLLTLKQTCLWWPYSPTKRCVPL